jgi:hypothetical protein
MSRYGSVIEVTGYGAGRATFNFHRYYVQDPDGPFPQGLRDH